MKMFRTFLASFVLLALTTAFSSNVNAQTTDQEIVWDGGASSNPFIIGTTNADQLNTEANWESSFRTGGNFSCGSSGSRVCKARFTYTGTPSSAITIADIITAVRNAYNGSGWSPNPFTVNNLAGKGVNVTITIVTKVL